MAREHLWMLTAILIGSLIVAVGAYLGLRSAQPATPLAPPVAAVAPIAAPAAKPVVVTQEVVTTQAIEALSYHRRLLLERCYRPLTLGATPPRVAKFVLNVSFDAAGSQVMRGIVEERESSFPELTGCVIEQLPALAVPPPGGPTMVEIPLALP